MYKPPARSLSWVRVGRPKGSGTRPLSDRLWEKVDKNGPIPAHRPELGPCWLWTASEQGRGYGQIGRDDGAAGIFLAHRAAYELLVGPIPEGLTLDHMCHNGSGCPGGPSCPHRRCVNPAHLEPASLGDNLRRGESLAAHQARQTHCVHGHEFTPENTRWWKGHRNCRTCDKRHEANRKARRHVDRNCGACGSPLPADCHGRRRYCDAACAKIAALAAERLKRGSPAQ